MQPMKEETSGEVLVKIKSPASLVSYKHVVFALPFVAAAAVAFGGFVLSQARAEGMGALKLAESVETKIVSLETKVEHRDAGLREDIRLMRADFERRHATTEQKVERVESKVDQVLTELRKQRRGP